MYLFYDNQGNLLSVNNQDIVVKGSSNANFIFVNVKGIDYAQYSAIATFKLPSASADTVQLVVSNTIKTIDYNGKQYQGYVIFLDDAITYYQGDVDFTLSLTKLGTSTTLNLEQFTFHVDESTISGEPWDAYINQAQYENIMNYITSGQMSFEYLGDIAFESNGSILARNFNILFSTPLRAEHSQGYYLVYAHDNDGNYVSNVLVSSYITYGKKGTEHFVYAVYRNENTNQFEAIGYKEIFNIGTTEYYDFSKGTTDATGDFSWDNGVLNYNSPSPIIKTSTGTITFNIEDLGINIGDIVRVGFNVAGGGGLVISRVFQLILLDENDEQLLAKQQNISDDNFNFIDILPNTKKLRLLFKFQNVQGDYTISGFSIKKYTQIMLPTTKTPDKNVYITQNSTNYQTLINSINNDITNIERNITSIEQDVSTLQQDVSDIQSDVNTINTTLGTLPYTCELTMNSQTYVVTLNLKDAKGTTLSTQSVDLPLESTVIGGSYDESSKAIVLTLKSGETISIPIGDLVDGLVSQSSFDTTINEINTEMETLQGSISSNSTKISKVEARRVMYPKKWKAKLLRTWKTSDNYKYIRLNFLDKYSADDLQSSQSPFGVINRGYTTAQQQYLMNKNLDFTMVFAMGKSTSTNNGIRKMGDKWGYSISGSYAPRTFTLNSATKPNITLDELATKVLQLIDPNCVIDSNITREVMPSWWRFPVIYNSTYQIKYNAPQAQERAQQTQPIRAYKINFNASGLFDMNKLGDLNAPYWLKTYFNHHCRTLMKRQLDHFSAQKNLVSGDGLHQKYPLIRLEIGFVHNFNLFLTESNNSLYPNEFPNGTAANGFSTWTGKLQNLYVELFMKFDNSNLDETMTANNQADCCYVWWKIHNRK